MAEIRFIGYITEKIAAPAMNVSLKQPMQLKDILEVKLSKDRCIVLINHQRGSR